MFRTTWFLHGIGALKPRETEENVGVCVVTGSWDPQVMSPPPLIVYLSREYTYKHACLFVHDCRLVSFSFIALRGRSINWTCRRQIAAVVSMEILVVNKVINTLGPGAVPETKIKLWQTHSANSRPLPAHEPHFFCVSVNHAIANDPWPIVVKPNENCKPFFRFLFLYGGLQHCLLAVVLTIANTNK